MIQEEEEEEQQQNMTEKLTGDTRTEFLRLLNEEDFSDAILDPKTIDLSFLQTESFCQQSCFHSYQSGSPCSQAIRRHTCQHLPWATCGQGIKRWLGRI